MSTAALPLRREAAVCRARPSSSAATARWVSRRVLAIPGKASALAGRRLAPPSGRKHERSDLLEAVVARSTHIQVYVQMHHDASANLAHRGLSLRVTERSSQPAESARCWLSSISGARSTTARAPAHGGKAEAGLFAEQVFRPDWRQLLPRGVRGKRRAAWLQSASARARRRPGAGPACLTIWLGRWRRDAAAFPPHRCGELPIMIGA